MIDTAQVRQHFPILSRLVHGRPLVYLDNAATTQKPLQVTEAISKYYLLHNANVHRGVHTLGDESTQLFHDSRRDIALFFGAGAAELVVTRNTTEAINLVAQSWARQHFKKGDVIIATQLEHHSNIVPWQVVAAQCGARVQYVHVTKQGEVDLQHLRTLLSDSNVKLVTLAHVSNTLGTVLPVETIADVVKKTVNREGEHPLLFVDGAQAASHVPIHFDESNIDFYAVSAHKMFGPMGIGGVFVKQDILEQMQPWLHGGGMIDTVTWESTRYAEDLEERFSAGTPDVAGLVGWAAACEYLGQFSWQDMQEHDQELVVRTIEMLRTFPQVEILGMTEDLPKRVGSVAFIYQGVHAHDVGQILDSVGVAVRSGHHCTMPLHHQFGWDASVRISFQLYNDISELETLREGLQKVQKVFGK